ncbi:thioredoxin reductase [archaeon]|nr:thioredoxin reductase [archaeon]|tara:strand:- start:179 stop:1078 length:900 start_codon:yes stop_codon:yes gene_type:complete
MHDLIIVGAGPAGMTAGIYAARYGLDTIIISEDVGGLMNEAEPVENWSGIKSIHGFQLMKNFKDHVEDLEVPIKTEEVKSVAKTKKGKDTIFKVKTKNKTYSAKSLIIASGSKRRKLEIPGEKKYEGKGIHYCATCDAPMYRNKTVGVVGGGESAAQAVMLLAQYAKKVYLMYRGDQLKTERIYIKRMEANKKVKIMLNTKVKRFNGNHLLKNIVLQNDDIMKLDGVFVEIGHLPSSELAEQLDIKVVDKKIVVNEMKETNVKGVFAAGDVTNTVLRQCVTACSDGAIAAYGVYNYLNQ